MHQESGEVTTLAEWKENFDHMDPESWFGFPADECEVRNWIKGGHLIEVKMVDCEWVKV